MKVILLLVALTFTRVAMAQHHDIGPIPVIKHVDGSKNPELIPDTIAYQNFFSLRSVSANASDEDRKTQSLKLRRLWLTSQDDFEMRLALAKYRARFDNLLEVYTKRAELGLATPDHFWTEVVKIVADTRADLDKHLSPAGKHSFETGVLDMRKVTVYTTVEGSVQ